MPASPARCRNPHPRRAARRGAAPPRSPPRSRDATRPRRTWTASATACSIPTPRLPFTATSPSPRERFARAPVRPRRRPTHAMPPRPPAGMRTSARIVSPPSECGVGAGYSAGQALKLLEPGRHDGPRRAVAGEDRDPRTKRRRVIQRAGVDRKLPVLADRAAEDETATNAAEITHGVVAVGRLAGELPRLTAEPHRLARKPHDRNEPATGRLAPVFTVAVPRVKRLTLRLIAHGTAETAAAVHRFAHRVLIIPAGITIS